MSLRKSSTDQEGSGLVFLLSLLGMTFFLFVAYHYFAKPLLEAGERTKNIDAIHQDMAEEGEDQ